MLPVSPVPANPGSMFATHTATNRAAGLLPSSPPLHPPCNSVPKVRVQGRENMCAARDGEGPRGALHNAAEAGRGSPVGVRSRGIAAAAALALPDANVPLWRRSGRPWVLFGSVGTCGRASLSSWHTGCWADNAGVKILGL